MTNTSQDCAGKIHPKAAEGIRLFNDGKFFEAHEELETAWNQESSPIRDLYRGILQIAVAYLHITRGNYDGAVKVYGRSLKWTAGWDDVCRGIDIGKLRKDAGRVMEEVERLGRNGIDKFDRSNLKPIIFDAQDDAASTTFNANPAAGDGSGSRVWICDRCGGEMRERNCKVTCPNCGNRFDCSDLNLYFD